ncbi:MAG: DinB family protein [Candidatus Acidiferrales bacterium]
MKLLLAVLVLALTPLALPAQMNSSADSKMEANPVSNAVRSSLDSRSKDLIAAAEEMPADKYNYRPTPAQMTFGHLVVHMAGSNYFLCSKISGMPAPASEKLSETDAKDKLVSALKSSFDFCTQSMAKVDDSNLGEPLKLWGGHSMSRAAAMIALTDDFYDHYSMAAMYLRLNGMLPPTAKEKE